MITRPATAAIGVLAGSRLAALGLVAVTGRSDPSAAVKSGSCETEGT